MLAQSTHEQLQFVECHILATADMDKNRIGIMKEAAAIEKRADQRVLERLLGPILTVCDTRPEEAARFG